jgi:hypothetical protein
MDVQDDLAAAQQPRPRSPCGSRCAGPPSGPRTRRRTSRPCRTCARGARGCLRRSALTLPLLQRDLAPRRLRDAPRVGLVPRRARVAVLPRPRQHAVLGLRVARASACRGSRARTPASSTTTTCTSRSRTARPSARRARRTARPGSRRPRSSGSGSPSCPDGCSTSTRPGAGSAPTPPPCPKRPHEARLRVDLAQPRRTLHARERDRTHAARPLRVTYATDSRTVRRRIDTPPRRVTARHDQPPHRRRLHQLLLREQRHVATVETGTLMHGILRRVTDGHASPVSHRS